MPEFSAREMMIIAAARALRDEHNCFVGIGVPSVAANLARRLYNPSLMLIYESGCIGAKPTRLPLSIGDSELSDTSMTVVSVPEIFNYWLQGGKVDVGFLGAAQIDRYGNLNSTVIGDYDHPTVRLPGAGGAPDIAAFAKEVFVVLDQSVRSFVPELGFVTSVGHFAHGRTRHEWGLPGGGPTQVITNLGILVPNEGELELRWIHPSVELKDVRQHTGWDLKISPDLACTSEPEEWELKELRRLEER
ncbi:MAG: CoA-transferase subunit beta [Ferrimicrobium sp.]|uniref:CoA-transferase subunit beta n=1 Tax=Ferrimicrobium acidiphilum TaxID=121039 RepID=A0ABV3XZP8_9ACTN|nr:CoA-transferase [Ferrimicrobium sp.]